MVQIPTTWNRDRPCIVTATSSGSRGIYGAIGTAGEWGLKRGCAVAYADKGTGNGVHDLATNTVTVQNGLRADADAAGAQSSFTAALPAPERAAFLAAFPHRIAVKHAHSSRTPNGTGAATPSTPSGSRSTCSTRNAGSRPTARRDRPTAPRTPSSSPPRCPTAARRRSPPPSRTPTTSSTAWRSANRCCSSARCRA